MFCMQLVKTNNEDPAQTPLKAASVLGLHCLSMCMLWDDGH